MPSTIPKLLVQNVVCTFHFAASLCLRRLTLMLPFVEFNAKRFAAAVMRLAHPRATCLVFSSGKAVCTGTQTAATGRVAAMSFVSLLRRCGLDVHMRDFCVQNIVCTTECPFRVNLTRLAQEADGLCSYEPDLFPGLMYRIDAESTVDDSHNTIVFIVFQSGKCVVTGGRTTEQAERCWNEFFVNVLQRYVGSVNEGSASDYRLSQIVKTATDSGDVIERLRKATKTDGSRKVHMRASEKAADRIRESIATRDVFVDNDGDDGDTGVPTMGFRPVVAT